MRIEQRIAELGIDLPDASAPLAMYVPVRQSGNLLFTAGQIPVVNGVPVHTGKAGGSLSTEQAQDAARVCIINMLAAVKNHLKDLDLVKKVVKIQVFVSSAPGFDRQHIVANAASELLFDVFGEAGRHARTAVGVNELPLDVPVEIEAVLEV